MIETLRTNLYVLGFLASLCYGARFFFQWLQSERAKQSTVTSLFWALSLLGSVLLVIHSVIQVQYHIALIQTVNGFIAFRHLNFKRNPWKLSSAVALLVILQLSVASLFAAQSYWLNEPSWFRNPTVPLIGSAGQDLPLIWMALQWVGPLLFSVRFWVQWYHLEHHQTAALSRTFWYISIVGSCFTLVAYSRIFDVVNIISPILGMIPYIRNLMLMGRKKELTS